MAFETGVGDTPAEGAQDEDALNQALRSVEDEDDEPPAAPQKPQKRQLAPLIAAAAVGVMMIAGGGFVLYSKISGSSTAPPFVGAPAVQPPPVQFEAGRPVTVEQQPGLVPQPASADNVPAADPTPHVAAQSVGVPPAAPSDKDVADLRESLSGLDTRIADLSTRLARIEERMTQALVEKEKRPTVAKVTAHVAGRESPGKGEQTPDTAGRHPETSLKFVVPGQVRVEVGGREGVYRVGDKIPGWGVVKSIDADAFRVVTQTGVIE